MESKRWNNGQPTGWKLTNVEVWQAPFGHFIGFKLHTPGLFCLVSTLNGEHAKLMVMVVWLLHLTEMCNGCMGKHMELAGFAPT
jgi:hypothetical protein